jgi:hypothetical protein
MVAGEGRLCGLGVESSACGILGAAPIQAGKADNYVSDYAMLTCESPLLQQAAMRLPAEAPATGVSCLRIPFCCSSNEAPRKYGNRRPPVQQACSSEWLLTHTAFRQDVVEPKHLHDVDATSAGVFWFQLCRSLCCCWSTEADKHVQVTCTETKAQGALFKR